VRFMEVVYLHKLINCLLSSAPTVQVVRNLRLSALEVPQSAPPAPVPGSPGGARPRFQQSRPGGRAKGAHRGYQVQQLYQQQYLQHQQQYQQQQQLQGYQGQGQGQGQGG